VDVGSLLMADPKTAKLIEPTKGSFYYPAPRNQVLLGVLNLFVLDSSLGSEIR
jgi:hypothetical protein